MLFRKIVLIRVLAASRPAIYALTSMELLTQFCHYVTAAGVQQPVRLDVELMAVKWHDRQTFRSCTSVVQSCC